MRDTARADDGSVSRLGVALTRRLLADCVAASTSRVCGSGLNQCLTFCREVGIPHPFPSKSSCWICLWPCGVHAYPWPPYARTWQGCSISASVSASRRRWRVGILSGCAARPLTLPGRPLPAAAWATYHYHPDSSACVHSPPLPGSRRYHAPRRGLLRLLWPAALRGILLPLSAPLCPGIHLQYSDLPLDPERGVGISALRRQRQIPFGGWGGGGVRAPLLHRLRSVPSPRYTSCLAHTPPSPARVRLPGRVILDPGPLGAHPPRGVPFLLRPAHPLLPPRGRVRCGCHGLLLGMIPALGRLRLRSDSFKRYVQLPSRCVPSPAPRVEVFGVTRGHSGPPPSPGSGRACGVALRGAARTLWCGVALRGAARTLWCGVALRGAARTLWCGVALRGAARTLWCGADTVVRRGVALRGADTVVRRGVALRGADTVVRRGVACRGGRIPGHKRQSASENARLSRSSAGARARGGGDRIPALAQLPRPPEDHTAAFAPGAQTHSAGLVGRFGLRAHDAGGSRMALDHRGGGPAGGNH